MVDRRGLGDEIVGIGFGVAVNSCEDVVDVVGHCGGLAMRVGGRRY